MDMLDSYIIVGLVMILVGVFKTFQPFTTKRGKLLVPLLVFGIAGILNTVNALVFGGQLMQALKDGFVLGAAAGGIYSMGKVAMQKYETVETIPPDPNVTANSVAVKQTEQNISGLS
jgi:uncharacterized membrane protein HdeD (DUF308 family)